MFSLSLLGCGNKEKVTFKCGTYGIESEGVSSSWAMTKYVFDKEKVSIYVLNQRVEDELNIYEYELSQTYEYTYNKSDNKVCFNGMTFDVKNKRLHSSLLDLSYESNSVTKPAYKVINSNCGNLQLQLDSNNEWIVIGTGSNMVTYEIPSEYKGYPITSISNNAFSLSPSLREITIPSSIKTIGSNVFKPLVSLEIIFENEVPCTQSNMLSNINNVSIVVPSNSVEAYKSAWTSYASVITSK